MSATVPYADWNPHTDTDHWLQVSSYCDRWCDHCRHRNRCVMAGTPLNGHLDPASVPKPPPEVLEAQSRQLMESFREFCEAEGCPVPKMETAPAPLFEDDALMRAARTWRAELEAWLDTRPDTQRGKGAGWCAEVLEWHCRLVPGKIYWAVAAAHYEERGAVELLRHRDPEGQAKAASMGLYACLNALNRHCESQPLDQRAVGLVHETAHLLEQLELRFPNHSRFVRAGFDD